MRPLRTLTASRYTVPLREGGSLPAVVETEEAGAFAVKFRGAGQGARALLAELIVGRLAERLGLPVPELALVTLDGGFGRAEPDPEIQDILKGSRGLNVGLRYLEGAFPYDPVAVADLVPADLAADVVWLDALTTNIDRTPRNPNLLIWERALWLIDHGAALYFHHNWAAVDEQRTRRPFGPIREHVLISVAGDLRAADARLAGLLTEEALRETLAEVPADLLMDAPEGTAPPFRSAEANREAYLRFFLARLEGPRAFVEGAVRAQEAARNDRPQPLGYRR
jgi:hypothetical protein